MTLIPNSNLYQQFNFRPEANINFRLPSHSDPVFNSTLWDLVKASWREDTSLSNIPSAVRNIMPGDPSVLFDEFDPFAHIPEGYEQWAERFMYARNENDIGAIKQQLDQAIRDREVLQEWGWSSVPIRIAMGLTDPIQWLIPASVGLKAWKTGKMLNALQTATNVGLAGMASTAVSETIIQQGDNLKTIEESVLDTVSAGIFSGIMGGSLSLVPKGKASQLQNALLADLKSIEIPGFKYLKESFNYGISNLYIHGLDGLQMIPEAVYIHGLNKIQIFPKTRSLFNDIIQPSQAVGLPKSKVSQSQNALNQITNSEDLKLSDIPWVNRSEQLPKLEISDKNVLGPEKIPEIKSGSMMASTGTGLEKKLAKLQFNPELTILAGKIDVPEVRDLFTEIVQPSVLLERNLDDIESSHAVEILKKRRSDDLMGNFEINIMENFTKLRKRLAKKPSTEVKHPFLSSIAIDARDLILNPFTSKKNRPLSWMEFKEAIVKAKRRWMEGSPPSNIPEINDVIKHLDEKIFRPILNDAENQKLIAKGLNTRIQQLEETKTKINELTAQLEDIQSQGLNDTYLKQINEIGNKISDLKKKMKETIDIEDKLERTKVRKSLKHEIGQAEQELKLLKYKIKEYNKGVNKIKRDLKKQKLLEKRLPEKIKQAEDFTRRYIPQIWNRTAIWNDEENFKKLLYEWQMNRKLLKATQDLQGSEQLEYINKLEQEVKEQVNQFVQDIKGSHDGFTIREVDRITGKTKFTRIRKIDIPDNMLDRFEKYLDNDLDKIIGAYVNSVVADIELSKRFGEGVEGVAMTKQLEAISAKYDELIAKETGSTKRLNDQRKKVLKILEAMRDRIRGVHGLPNDPNSMIIRINDSVLIWNTLRALGGVTISQIPDMARPIMRYGLQHIGKLIVKLATNPKHAGMSLREARLAAAIWELIRGSRMANLSEFNGTFLPKSKFEMGLEKFNQAFGHITLMNQFNHITKSFTALATSHYVLEAAKNIATGKPIKKKMTLKLREMGLSDNDLKLIWTEFSDKGINHNGLLIAQSGDWKNKSIAEKFQNALRIENDRIIVSPGFGQKPLMASNSLGKHIFQFRSFGFAAVNSVLFSGLQYKDAAFMTGALASIALGALSFNIKKFISGRDMSYDPAELIFEGFDRSGISGFLSDVMVMKSQITGGMGDIRSFFGVQPASKFSAHNMTGIVFGPTLGTFEDSARASMTLFDIMKQNDVSEYNRNAFFRLLPYSRLWWLRAINNNFLQGSREYIE